jgi:hypothetical protein
MIVVFLAACSPRPSVPARGRETAKEDEPASEPSDADSTRLPAETGPAREKLLESGVLDDAQPADPEDASVDTAEVPATERGGGSARFELDALAGFRSELRVRVQGLRGFSAGARFDEKKYVGFIRLDGKGVVRSIQIGRVTVRSGERLLLGRGMGSYGTAGVGPVRTGFAASPSFSRWYGCPGTAVELGWHCWRLAAAALGPTSEESSYRPTSLWTTLLFHRDRGSAGITIGQPSGHEAVAATPESGREVGPRVLSAFASYRSRGVETSCETAAVEGGRTFFAVRVLGRTKTPRSRWSALFFRVPHESPLGASGLEPPRKTDQGTAIEFARHVGPVDLSTSLVAGRTRSDERQGSYRRLKATLSRRGAAPVWWEASVVQKHGSEATYPTNPVELESVGKTTTGLRLRAAFGIRETAGRGARTSSSVRIDFSPGNGETERALVIVLSSELAGDRLEGRLQVASHSLPPGQPLFLSRPGVGAREWLSALYGRGSDVCFRGTLRLSRSARALVFYGSSWSGLSRVYLGLVYRR